ncbi:MAG: hypothetical protein VZR06_11965 [Butyrivibrio sp.]|jgi:hypothetical protein|nr:hypothetical protein [Butyrivibrio sp.]
MKIKRTLLIFATTLAVTGCTPIATEGDTESLESQEEAAADDATAEVASEEVSLADETNEETTEAEAEAAAVEAAKAVGEPVSDEELSTFTKMFTDEGCDYFGFLWPEYSSPEEIKWDQAIGCYTKSLDSKLTDDEKKELYGTTDIEGYIVDTAIKKTDLSKFIKDHTGLDVTLEAKDVPSWQYNEKCDAFLVGENPWGQDSPMFDGKFVSGTKAGDVYTLTFQPNNENWGPENIQPDRSITFTKSGDKLVIKSNKYIRN